MEEKKMSKMNLSESKELSAAELDIISGGATVETGTDDVKEKATDAYSKLAPGEKGTQARLGNSV